MLEKNYRVNYDNGMSFLEKDILYDNYTYTSDIIINIDLTYVNAGFGIVLMNSSGDSINDKNGVYLFKIGYKEASIYYSTKTSKTLINQISCLEAFTIQEHLKFKLKKENKKITLYLNNKEILHEYIEKDLDRYNIGYYSNKNNKINNISIESNVPSGWSINMKNTLGGYISFQDNSFLLTDCKYNAEIEQSKIFLQKGIYYLKHNISNINNKETDINFFVFPSEESYVGDKYDNRLFDEKKNIVNRSNGVFIVPKDNYYTLRYTGTSGKVSNILISDKKDDIYVPTTEHYIDFKGSYLDIYLNDILKITWTGKIFRTPFDINNNENVSNYSIIMDSETKIRPFDIQNLSYGIEYDFVFDLNTCQFYVYKDGECIHKNTQYILRKLSNKITIFNNITAEISKLIIYKKDGQAINLNIQDEYNKVITADIKSPILVLDEYNLPLDLSSSYRKCIYNDYSKYKFTNWEREHFKVEKIIKLTNPVLKKQDSIIIHAIRKGVNIDIKNIYNVKNDNINSIDLLTNSHDTFYEKDIIHIDYNSNKIYLKEDLKEKYQLLIIDYLKEDSYCINFDYIKNVYNVSISSSKENNKIIYNSSAISNNVYQINEYKGTSIDSNINGYIVLKK